MALSEGDKKSVKNLEQIEKSLRSAIQALEARNQELETTNKKLIESNEALQIDASELKVVHNQQLREARLHEKVVADINEFIVRWTADSKTITYANPAYAHSLNSTPADLAGQNLISAFKQAGFGKAERDRVLKGLNDSSKNLKPGEFDRYRTDVHIDLTGKERAILWQARAIDESQAGTEQEIQSIGVIITDTHRYKQSLEQLVFLTGSLSASDASGEQILEKILQCGCQYLQTDTGIVRQLGKEGFVTKASYGDVVAGLDDAVPLPLKGNPLHAEGTGKFVTIENFSGTLFENDTSLVNSGLESYIGICVGDGSGATWLVVFGSLSSHLEEFTDLERSFVSLLGRFTSFELERRYYVESLLNNQRELELVNDNLSQFSYVASHDLQEPLRKIRQFGELLVEESREQLTGDASHFVDVMTSSAERMNTLIRDLLAFSKSSNCDLKLENRNLGEMLEQAQQELESTILELSATIKLDKLPSAECDPTLVKQLFLNLLSNSLKYRSKDVAPKIKIENNEQENDYVITVTDNGIGIDTNTKQDIFKAFTRLHSRDEYEGSGIGLAACQMACKRHGWDISLDQSFTDGARFLIHIPKFN